MRLVLDLNKATKDKSKLILITKQIIRNGIIVTNKYWVTPEQAKAMLTTPFNLDEFWKLANSGKRDEALTYAKKHGVKWDEMSHKQQNWLKAVKAIKDFAGGKAPYQKPTKDVTTKQANSSPDLNSSTVNSNNSSLQELQNALDNRKNDWSTLLKLAKNNGITWTESDNNDINKMRVSMAVSKFLKNNGATVGVTTPKKETPKKDTSVKTPKKAEPKKRKEPPKSERSKRIEKAFNKMSKEEAHICKVTGIIGEDPESVAYITQFLYPRYRSTVHDIEKELKNLKEAGKKKLDKSKLTGLASKHIQNEVSSWYMGVLPMYRVPTPDSSKYEENERKFAQSPKLLESMKKAREVKTTQLMSELINGYSTVEEHLAMNTFFKLTPGGVRLPDAVPYSKDPKMINQFLFESLKVLQNDDHFKETAIEVYDNFLDIFTILRDEFDSQIKSKGEKPEEYSAYMDSAKEYVAKVIEGVLDDNDEFSESPAKGAIKNLFSIFYDTSKGRDMLTNLSFFGSSTWTVASSNWKDPVWDWDYVTPITDFSAMETPNINSVEAMEMKDRLAIEIASMKPSLNSSGKKSAQEIKDEMHGRYDEVLAMLKAYDLQNIEDLVGESLINCILSYTPKDKAVEIIKKINNDWDYGEHGGFKPKVRGVYKVEGLPVEKDFNRIKAIKGNLTTLYHGTGTLATVSIVGKSGQFKVIPNPKVGRTLGDGIYLADKSSKSAQYINDKSFSRALGNSGSLMICDAVLGKKSNSVHDKDADTVEALKADRAWSVVNNEWCVKNPKAVIPRYLVHTELVNPHIKL